MDYPLRRIRLWCRGPFDRRERHEERCAATPASPPSAYAQCNVGKGSRAARCGSCRGRAQRDPPITREADGSHVTAGPKSAEGRDPESDPLRQSSRARQYRRNQIRRASSIVRGAPVPAGLSFAWPMSPYLFPSVARIVHGNCLQDLNGPRRARPGQTGIGSICYHQFS